jgi:predicted dehydrogenase
MVAYNRRFELAYERFAEELDKLDQIHSVTAHAVDADFSRTLPDIYDTIHPDLSEEFIQESTAQRREQCERAIETEGKLAEGYDFQIEHICHDVNALRDLFGDVDTVEYVDFDRNGYFGTAHIVFEGGEQVVLQSGDSDRHFHEQFIRVDSPSSVIQLDFEHPFVRYNGATLSVRSGETETSNCQYSPTREESFKRELEHFIACVREGETPKTTFAQARDDVALICQLFEEYKQ